MRGELFKLLKRGELTEQDLRRFSFRNFSEEELLQQDEDGNTVFHLVFTCLPSDIPKKPFIRQFLSWGFNPELVNNKEQNPLHVAIKLLNDKIPRGRPKRKLVEQLAKQEQDLLETIEMLVDYGVDIEQEDEEPHSPLVLANKPITRSLLMKKGIIKSTKDFSWLKKHLFKSDFPVALTEQEADLLSDEFLSTLNKSELLDVVHRLCLKEVTKEEIEQQKKELEFFRKLLHGKSMEEAIEEVFGDEED